MANKAYKELQDELNKILGELQAGDVSVDRALTLYKEGHKLIQRLEEQLKLAENETRKLTS